MSDWRELVRVAIIETIKNESWAQFENTKKLVENAMNEYSSRIPGYKEDARINIELVVPIQLPPNGRKGDCKKVVETVRDQFIELGGGAQIYPTTGSWVSLTDGLNEDSCLIVYTEIPVMSWYNAIPVLRNLIEDEIQSKLLQQCVFIRIDCNNYSGPINLLKGEKLAEVKAAAGKFKEIDSSCYELAGVEHIESEVKQGDILTGNLSIKGNKNIQINSKDNATSAVGSGSIAAGGNITVNHSGVPIEKVAQLLGKQAESYNQLMDRLSENFANEKLTNMHQKLDDENHSNSQKNIHQPEVSENDSKQTTTSLTSSLNNTSKEILLQIFKKIEDFLPSGFIEFVEISQRSIERGRVGRNNEMVDILEMDGNLTNFQILKSINPSPSSRYYGLICSHSSGKMFAFTISSENFKGSSSQLEDYKESKILKKRISKMLPRKSLHLSDDRFAYAYSKIVGTRRIFGTELFE